MYSISLSQSCPNPVWIRNSIIKVSLSLSLSLCVCVAFSSFSLLFSFSFLFFFCSLFIFTSLTLSLFSFFSFFLIFFNVINSNVLTENKTAKVLTEADGSRVLRISLELVDSELFDALQKVLAFTEIIKFDASLECSEKPVHHPTEEFFKFRATADVQWKRSVLVLGQHLLHRFFHPPGRGPANWRCRQYNFIALLARSNIFLEFDDVQEFWETAVQVGPEHRMKRIGWHSLARTAEEELGRIPDFPLADTYDKVVKSLVGIHSMHVVLSGQQVLEVKAENFDIFTLLPTMQEVKELKTGN